MALGESRQISLVNENSTNVFAGSHGFVAVVDTFKRIGAGHETIEVKLTFAV
jgi:hypothetical protein